MQTLEGVTIQNSPYGEMSLIDGANLNNCTSQGGTVIWDSSTAIHISGDTLINIDDTVFTANDLKRLINLAEKLEKVYPELFI